MRVAHICIACFAVATLAPTLHAQTRQWDTLPADMRRAMEHTAANINPITISFTYGTQPGLPREEAVALLRWPGPPEAFFHIRPYRFVWQDGKVYMDHINDSGRYQTAFNGAAFYSIAEDAILRTRPASARWATSPFGTSYLPSVGISLTGSAYDPVIEPHIRTLLETAAQINGVHTIRNNGQTLTLLSLITPNEVRSRAVQTNLDQLLAELRRSANTEEQNRRTIENVRRQRELPELVELRYTLDPDRNYAVVSIEKRYLDGTLLQRTQNSDFEYLAERNLWLPRSIRIDYYTASTTPGEVFDHPPFSTIIDVDADFGLGRVADETFTPLDIRPGMRIYDDLSTNQQVQIKVEPGMEDQVRAFLAADPSGLPPGSIPIPTAPGDQPHHADADSAPAATAHLGPAALEPAAPSAVDPPRAGFPWTTTILIIFAAGAVAVVIIFRRIV